MRTRALLVLLLAAAAAPARAASIINSKHDLSVQSATTGPKATAQTDTCLFCHAAHRVASAQPLWNRPDSQVSFTFYSSNYLNNYLGQTAPTLADLKGSRSRLCLSCHDGVTALGAVYNLAPNTVAMSGAMSPPAVIGADLRNHHPVLYDVRPGAGPPAQPGTDPEIRLPPANDAVRVFGPTSRVECSSCHDAHNNQFGSFLVKPNANAALCTTCHQKTNYSASAHATSNAVFTPPGATATTVREWSCRGCHKTHGASTAQAYLLAAAEEATCYQCHGSPSLPGTSDIKSQLLKASVHPVESASGLHVNPELDASNLGPAKRHSECWDCHNPHQSQSGTHTPPTNLVSNALLGQWGVEPSWSGTAFSPATAYARQVFTNTRDFKEYQLCLKCHSSYAFGQTPPMGATDQSVEFNPANLSAHPVRDPVTAPLDASVLSAPWAAKPGAQTMYCSDCHGSDATSDPQGPHGSAGPRLLKGPAAFWPLNASGALWTLSDVKNGANNWSGALFCVNCHPLLSGNKWLNNAHDAHDKLVLDDGKPVRCVNCHVAVPHGAKRSRLIGYDSELSPYNYGGPAPDDRLLVTGFKKAPGPGQYRGLNCYSKAVSCHHHSNQGGYDP